MHLQQHIEFRFHVYSKSHVRVYERRNRRMDRSRRGYITYRHAIFPVWILVAKHFTLAFEQLISELVAKGLRDSLHSLGREWPFGKLTDDELGSHHACIAKEKA